MDWRFHPPDHDAVRASAQLWNKTAGADRGCRSESISTEWPCLARNWLTEREQAWRDGIAVVAMDGFSERLNAGVRVGELRMSHHDDDRGDRGDGDHTNESVRVQA